MESTLVKNLCFALFFAFVIVRLRGEEVRNRVVQGQTSSLTNADLEKDTKTHNEVVVNDKKRNNGGGGGGVGWGWGGGGGGANQQGGWGWGNGGGGGVSWRWGCGVGGKGQRLHKKRNFPVGDYKIGEFAQCSKGRCLGMKLDCPLHCGGPCFYDCRHMCKAHCKR
ncbi:hypothetical protein CASFOL_021331 [Castilleja foliolosa]|uniref:Uncharacterized protein n=1 Tax=Castilleja foliolosa TaxID=1961234 RepID=A0ABD3D0D6_9LAMI